MQQLSTSSPEGNAPRVSVVIPTYNSRAFLGEAVASALAQTLPPHEVIVIDDGSTDGSDALLDELARDAGGRVVVIRQANRGVAAARNAGLRAARGDLIAFLDADDVWSPEKLAVQCKALTERPDLVLLGSETYGWPGPQPALRDDAPAIRTIASDALAIRNYLTTSSIIVRRSAVERAGEFDVELRGPEDHDYWLRIAECGGIGVLRAPLTGYRVVPGSLSRRAHSMEAGMRRILAKLDARDFWRGRSLLRRRAYGYVSCSAAQLYGSAGDQPTAMRRVLDSLVWYPLPFSRAEAGVPLVRPKRLAVAFLRLLGLKRPDHDR